MRPPFRRSKWSKWLLPSQASRLTRRWRAEGDEVKARQPSRGFLILQDKERADAGHHGNTRPSGLRQAWDRDENDQEENVCETREA